MPMVEGELPGQLKLLPLGRARTNQYLLRALAVSITSGGELHELVSTTCAVPEHAGAGVAAGHTI